MSYYDAWHKPVNPPLSATNPHFKSKFSPLDKCEKAWRDTLAPHKLALRVAPVYRDGQQLMVATIVDKDGNESEAASCLMQLPADPQKAGSAITYYRRYVGNAALGLVGDQDDDGNAAVPTSPSKALDGLRKQVQRIATQKKLSAQDISTDLMSVFGDLKELDAGRLIEAGQYLTDKYER